MKLQEIRKAKNLSQSQLANLSGVPLKTLQKYEIGDRNIDNADISNVCDLAMALNVKFYELLESDELIKKIKSTI